MPANSLQADTTDVTILWVTEDFNPALMRALTAPSNAITASIPVFMKGTLKRWQLAFPCAISALLFVTWLLNPWPVKIPSQKDSVSYAQTFAMYARKSVRSMATSTANPAQRLAEFALKSAGE